MIRIIAVGKKHDPLLAGAIDDYQKRLRAPFDVKWHIVSSSAADGASARRDESQAILSMLTPSNYVILLDERGEAIDSPGLSARLDGLSAGTRPVTMVIGGAFGVADGLTDRADFVWSLSPLVFPHQLVRLLLVEQLYRAQSIRSSGRYHHE